MKPLLFTVMALSFISFGHVSVQTDGPVHRCLRTVADIRLPGNPTRFDYQSIDPERSLLFIAHLGDNAVTVFDLKSHRVLRNITGVPGPHGILAVPELGKVFVSATGANEIYVLDEKSLTVVGKVRGGYFPDGIGYAAQAGRIFVSDEFGKTVSVIDARSLKPVRTIKIGGRVGNTHYDPASNLIYTADESANELTEINPSTLEITGRIKLPGCGGAHGFTIGEMPHYAYVTGEDNSSLVVVDLANRKVIQTFAVGSGPDVLAIDDGLNLLYVASESGVITIFKIGGARISKLCEWKLWAHAHTVSVDQATHMVYFPLQDFNDVPTLKIMLPARGIGTQEDAF